MQFRHLLLWAGLMTLCVLSLRRSDRRRPTALPAPRRSGGKRQLRAVAFRDAEPVGPSARHAQVRPAGAESTRDDRDGWDAVDEASDESFPASDPPARY